ncbi:hypothetical protein [Alicyclobacillus sp. ALC3]|uniref:hypothetical protein n=1 Tax=Alicyclobacillus sp. ALC3 TaxID=2796143 RepID=UPI0023780CAA|nr:hypothetical protein [Alicyclobacillus sp. ALC3]WDL98053.1 hypothetical protein JC200_04935 [Alicyclobacillus sp. ALC3]
MDQMDWTHQWDDFEMFMYVVGPDEDVPGIYMQVSQRDRQEGVEQWEILYDRKIADLEQGDLEPAIQSSDAEAGPGSEVWEERILRRQLRDHPDLVDREKEYLQEHLAKS